MRLFKIILVIFAVYFIRRFWQLYRTMEKRGRELRDAENSAPPHSEKKADPKTVEAEYKVVDR